MPLNTPPSDRPSGRKNNQLREIKITRQYTRYAEGSVLIEMGQTKVLCNASVLNKVPPHQPLGSGWVTAEYGMLPRSTHTRSEREAKRGGQNGRTQEIQRLIGRALRAVVDLDQLGPRTIHLDCDVLQADGGTRTAAITGAYVALCDAINTLQTQQLLQSNPIHEAIAAISVGLYQDKAILDLDYEEDSHCDTDMNIVMTASGKLIEIQGTAEGIPFSQQQLATMIALAEQGIQTLIQIQKSTLETI